MKVNIEYDDKLSSDEVVIKCKEKTRTIEEIFEYINNMQDTMSVYEDGKIYKIFIADILYFDSVDSQTFVYLEDKIYSTDSRLYELEETLSLIFVRVSKSCLLNLNALKSVSRQLNGRLSATLKNGEEIVINRSYVRSFKERFGV